MVALSLLLSVNVMFRVAFAGEGLVQLKTAVTVVKGTAESLVSEARAQLPAWLIETLTMLFPPSWADAFARNQWPAVASVKWRGAEIAGGSPEIVIEDEFADIEEGQVELVAVSLHRITLFTV